MSTKKEKCCEKCHGYTTSKGVYFPLCNSADCHCHQSESIEFENEFDREFPDSRDVFGEDPYGSRRKAVKSFLLHKLQEERERMMATIKKEKETWANQSIGWKAVESVENALNHKK